MISVGLATYNGEKYIEEQLNSILNQTRRPDEVIIVDDKSSDNTVEIINKFLICNNLNYVEDDNNVGGWKVRCNQKNKGFYQNFLDIIMMTKGEIVYLSDQDDIWETNKIEVLEKSFQINKEVYAAFSNSSIIDASGNVTCDYLTPIICHRKLPMGGEVRFGDIVGFSDIRGCSLAFRGCLRTEIMKFNAYPSKLGHDWIVTMIAAIYGKVLFINAPLFRYRIHETNTSKRTSLLHFKKKKTEKTKEIKEFLEVHKKILIEYSDMLSGAEKQQLCEMIRFYACRIQYYENGRIDNAIQMAKNFKLYKRCSRSVEDAVVLLLTDLIHGF